MPKIVGEICKKYRRVTFNCKILKDVQISVGECSRYRSGGLFLLSSSFPPKALLRGCSERPERVKKERGEECWCNKNESLFYSSLVSPGYKFPPFLREAKLRNPLIFPYPSFRKKITTIILWLCDSLSWRA